VYWRESVTILVGMSVELVGDNATFGGARIEGGRFAGRGAGGLDVDSTGYSGGISSAPYWPYVGGVFAKTQVISGIIKIVSCILMFVLISGFLKGEGEERRRYKNCSKFNRMK